MLATADGKHLVYDLDDAGESPNSSLDNQQYHAVTSPVGVTRVVAGPGAGKTRVITARVTYLIRELKIPPEQLLAITFTNRAAAEMRTRIKEVLGPTAADQLYAGTFHSWCARLIRRHHEVAGLGRNFSIYDRDDTTAVVAAIMDSQSSFHHNQLKPAHVVNYMTACKSRGETAAMHANHHEHDDSIAAVRSRIWLEYERALQRHNALDFDDLLLRALALLREHPEIMRETADQYRHLMVDEYQDTCYTQQDLVNGIARNHDEPSLFIVGDPDQSIYAFRHARVQGILDFQQAFDATSTYFLTRNYRSTATIIDASQELISYNNARIDRSAHPVHGDGALIQWLQGEDQADEARQIAQLIRDYAARHGTPWSDFCIAYRTHAQSHHLAAALRQAHVPSLVASGYDFFNRIEIKAYLAWLRLAANQQDDAALKVAVISPRRGVGRATIDRLSRLAQQQDQDLTATIRRVVDGYYDDQPEVTRRLRLRATELNALAGFQSAVETVQELAEYATPADLIVHLTSHTGLDQFVASMDGDADERRSFVRDLLDMADPDRYPAGALTPFLEHIAIERDRRGAPADADGIPRVTLTTLHQAKGLEFPVCIIAAAHDQQLPHFMARSPSEREEERRLFYVGMTRAMEQLVISWHLADANRDYGPSPFVYDIPECLWQTPLPD